MLQTQTQNPTTVRQKSYIQPDIENKKLMLTGKYYYLWLTKSFLTITTLKHAEDTIS